MKTIHHNDFEPDEEEVNKFSLIQKVTWRLFGVVIKIGTTQHVKNICILLSIILLLLAIILKSVSAYLFCIFFIIITGYLEIVDDDYFDDGDTEDSPIANLSPMLIK